jgi:hypothetical protein
MPPVTSWPLEMTDTLSLATAHGGAIPSPLTIVIAVAAVAYVLWSRTQGRPLTVRRMLILPAVLAVIGITDLTGSSAPHLTSKDIVFLLTSVALSAVLGAARGTTIELYPEGGELWQRYRRNTVLLWILLIASKLVLAGVASAAGASAGAGTNGLLLSLGVSLLAEAAIVGPRALSTGLPFATNRQRSDGDRYRSISSSPPVTRSVDVVPPKQRPIATPMGGDLQPRSRRHEHGSRHHCGPAHRLVARILEAQADQRQTILGVDAESHVPNPNPR